MVLLYILTIGQQKQWSSGLQTGYAMKVKGVWYVYNKKAIFRVITESVLPTFLIAFPEKIIIPLVQVMILRTYIRIFTYWNASSVVRCTRWITEIMHLINIRWRGKHSFADRLCLLIDAEMSDEMRLSINTQVNDLKKTKFVF